MEEAFHDSRQRIGRPLVARESPECSRGRSQVFQPIQIDEDRANADALELLGRGDVDARVVKQDEIGMPRRHGLHVRRQTFSDAGDAQRCGRVITPLRTADDLIACPDREQDFGKRGKQRDDALRRGSVVPTCRRATCEYEEYSNGEPSQHHPSREGTDWWRERRRLLASGEP